MSFVKFGLPKSKQTKFEDLSVTNQFDLLLKYTAMLCKVINIDDKVHVLHNHGAPVWADRCGYLYPVASQYDLSL